MRVSGFLTGSFAVLAALAWAHSAATAQTYPTKLIRIISPVPAGGLSDIALRPLVQQLSKRLGQPVIVENRPGASGLVAGRACAQAQPDGYTICHLLNDTVINAPFLFKDVGYDAARDFAPITNNFFITSGIIVTPELKVNTLQELIDLSKKRPEGINFGSPATTATMFMETLKQDTGANFVTIPYKSGGEIATAILTHAVDMVFGGIGTVVSHLQSGTLKALVVEGTTRSSLLPNVPTLKEAGNPGLRVRAWYGFFAPAGTPTGIINKLHDEIVQIYDNQDFRQRTLIDTGLEPALNTPEEFARFLDEDRKRTAVLAQRAEVHPE
ncbi:MAG: tripartite tricarboxylate transporter substrate binding protein [Xanthobacteraceae bacterium]|jgi:tripartite-type tricarboxylate transporter receptor subunit TctC